MAMHLPHVPQSAVKHGPPKFPQHGHDTVAKVLEGVFVEKLVNMRDRLLLA